MTEEELYLKMDKIRKRNKAAEPKSRFGFWHFMFALVALIVLGLIYSGVK